MQKLNTHYYDGKIVWKYEKLKTDLAEAKEKNEIPSLSETAAEIKEIIEKNLNGIQKATAYKMLQLLLSDKGKWDNANKINVHDLLPLVWYKVRKYDPSGLQLFLEQLIDIKGGQCPQGRVTRLLQLVE